MRWGTRMCVGRGRARVWSDGWRDVRERRGGGCSVCATVVCNCVFDHKCIVAL